MHKIRIQRLHASLALHRLHHHGTDGLVDRCLQRVKIICRSITEARRKGIKILMQFILPGCGERFHRAAVEGIFQRDDRRAARPIGIKAIFARELHRAFIRLCSGICKKHTRKTRFFA